MFLQIVILMIVLACMVMVLLAIRQLTHFEGFEDSKNTHQLKEEVEDDRHILSHSSIFSTLVEADPEEEKKNGNYKRGSKSNSKEPFSRSE